MTVKREQRALISRLYKLSLASQASTSDDNYRRRIFLLPFLFSFFRIFSQLTDLLGTLPYVNLRRNETALESVFDHDGAFNEVVLSNDLIITEHQ